MNRTIVLWLTVTCMHDDNHLQFQSIHIHVHKSSLHDCNDSDITLVSREILYKSIPNTFWPVTTVITIYASGRLR